MRDRRNLRLYATKNESSTTNIIFFMNKNNKGFLVRGVQNFKVNNLNNYEEITNRVIINYLIKIHNELIEELMTKEDLSINPLDFYIQ